MPKGKIKQENFVVVSYVYKEKKFLFFAREKTITFTFYKKTAKTWLFDKKFSIRNLTVSVGTDVIQDRRKGKIPVTNLKERNKVKKSTWVLKSEHKTRI